MIADDELTALKQRVARLEAENARLIESEVTNILFAQTLKQIVMTPPDLNPLNFVIEQTGRHVGADRSYVYLFRQGGKSLVCDNAHSWCADSIDQDADSRRFCDLAKFPPQLRAIADGVDLVFPTLDQLDQDTRQWLENHDIRSMIVTPVIARGGTIAGFVGFDFITHSVKVFSDRIVRCIHEVSDIISVCLERRAAINRANQAERSKNDFFAAVSHDIRTPLNSIIGFSRLLKDGEYDHNQYEKYLDNILYSANTLLEIVNDTLDLAKLGAGRMIFYPEPCDFIKLVNSLVNSFTLDAHERGLNIRAELEEFPCIGIDAHRIRQVLFNLVGNALKFTPAGSVTVRGSFERKTAERGILRFSVTDTGIGIAHNDIAKMMLPFVQLGGPAGAGGTGLGLSICKQIVDAMGGFLSVTSSLGHGSTFAVEIPNVKWRAKPICPENQQKKNNTQTTTDATHDYSNMTVLIVDDLDINRRVICAWCRKLGIGNLIEAKDGEEALSLLNDKIDMILTDKKMPGMDGIALIQQIRKHENCQDVPVYLVTADVDARTGYRELGFSGVLLKPIDIHALTNAVDRCRQIRQTR